MVGLIYRRVGVEPGIGHDTVDKIVDYARNAVNPTEPLIQAGFCGSAGIIGMTNVKMRRNAFRCRAEKLPSTDGLSRDECGSCRGSGVL